MSLTSLFFDQQLCLLNFRSTYEEIFVSITQKSLFLGFADIFRFQLNCKKSKVDEYPMRKTNVFPAQQLLALLSNDSSNENFKDESCKMPLSTSLAGGNMNVCKTRVLNFMLTERIVHGLLGLEF